MPSLSGLHMCRTTSIGHSSRASRSISSWSGRRFLANSRNDFRLSFNVLLVIIFYSSLRLFINSVLCFCSSFRRNAVHFEDLVRQFGQELEDIVHNSDVCHLEYWGFRVLVYRNDKRIPFKSSQMLERATDAACQVDLGLHGFAG